MKDVILLWAKVEASHPGGRRRWGFPAAANIPSAPRAETEPGRWGGRGSSSGSAGFFCSRRTPAWGWRPGRGGKCWQTDPAAADFQVKRKWLIYEGKTGLRIVYSVENRANCALMNSGRIEMTIFQRRFYQFKWLFPHIHVAICSFYLVCRIFMLSLWELGLKPDWWDSSHVS